MDRADIVQYVDLPPREAIYEILRGCLLELVRKGIVAEVVSGFSQPEKKVLTTNYSRTSQDSHKLKYMNAQLTSPI